MYLKDSLEFFLKYCRKLKRANVSVGTAKSII